LAGHGGRRLARSVFSVCIGTLVCGAAERLKTAAREALGVVPPASVMGRWSSSSKVHPAAGFVLLSVVGVGPPLHTV